LREPLSSLARADVFILTRCDVDRGAPETGDLAILNDYLEGPRIYKTSHVPVLYKWLKANRAATGTDGSLPSSCELFALRGKKVFAFSGVAENNDFKNTLEKLQCELTGFMGFPDHHPYSDNDLVNILNCQRNAAADLLCTTEKDYVRISDKINWPTDLVVIGVEISFGDDDGNFHAFIKSRLEED
jgi:tetraacyldisaccharide 4'-kinase